MKLSERDKMDAIVYEVGTLIKLVAGRNVTAICKVANEVAEETMDEEEIEEIPNNTLYERYCEYGSVKS